MISPLFVKLYFSVATVILGSIFAVSIAFDYYDSADMYFVRDVKFVVKKITSTESLEKQAIKIDLLKEMYGFEIRYLTTEQSQLFQKKYQFIKSVENLDVFSLNDDDKAALLKIDKNILLIADFVDRDTDEIDKLDEEIERLENSITLYLFAFISVSVAFVLYRTVRNIAKQVNELSNASSQLAKGQWETRVNENIPAPLQQMAASFNNMAASLQYAQNQQKVMANAIAHELRTPLTRMQLALGLLRDTTHDDFTQALHQDINNYAVEMELLANDILMLQTLEHQAIEQQDIDLEDLLAKRVEEFQREFAHIQLTANLSPLKMSANLRLLTLIVDNLIKNACMYSHDQVKISLSAEEGEYQLIVEDDGDGIVEELRQHVFEPFTRLDNSRSRQTGGFGLGLAIVNSVVKRMHGDIHISDSALGGARFTVKWFAR